MNIEHHHIDLATAIPASGRIGVALGGGGARGLAHIVILEAFDELGIKPAMIAGTSIGAIAGWCYASGMPAREIHAEIAGRLRDRRAMISRIFEARVGRFVHLVSGRGNPMLVDLEVLLPRILPAGIAQNFEDLNIPLLVPATDFHARTQVVHRTGAILPAVAGSAAVPGLVRPVLHDSRVLVDGGAINPLPFDLLEDFTETVIAVDITGGVAGPAKALPDSWEAMFASIQILQGVIVQSKLARRAPDALIRPDVGGFKVLEFFKAPAIMRAAEPAKDELKRALERMFA